MTSGAKKRAFEDDDELDAKICNEPEDKRFKYDPNVINDARTISTMIKVEEEYAKGVLAKFLKQKDRVQLAINYIMDSDNKLLSETESTSDSDDDVTLYDLIPKVVRKVKDRDKKFIIDLNRLHDLLKGNRDSENVVEIVSNLLLNADQNSRKNGHLDTEVSVQTNKAEESEEPKSGKTRDVVDILREETLTLSKIFPDVDSNELFAYLEHYRNRENRKQLVIEEILGTKAVDSQSTCPMFEQSVSDNTQSTPPTLEYTNSFEDDQPFKENEEDEQIKLRENTQAPSPKASHSKSEEDKKGEFFDEIETVRKIFPDCDPNYIAERLYSMSSVPDRMSKLTAEMIETKRYPKLKDHLEAMEYERQRQKWLTMTFHAAEFLKMCPDPIAYYYDETRPVSQSYKDHCLKHLQNECPMLHAAYIKKVFTKHNEHLCPTLAELRVDALNYIAGNYNNSMKSAKFRQIPRRFQESLPDKPDEHFYREVLFLRHEDRLKDFLKKKEQEHILRRQDAKDLGEMMECQCCFDDEVLPEDMIGCGDDHLFCKECVRRAAEEQIANSKVTFPCLRGVDECTATYNLTTLQDVLTTKLMSLLLKRVQEEEIRQAGIEDLVGCPFCSFATIMPNPNDKVLCCLNPECMKPSCRLCKEESHIPLSCDEVEKRSETNIRTYIENKMAEAMIRTCYRCNKRFYKLEGCNKMTCSCGASMCYVCRQPITGYDHFNTSGCPTDTNVFELHRKEIESAMREAKATYRNDTGDGGEGSGDDVWGAGVKEGDLRAQFDPQRHLADIPDGNRYGEGYDDVEYSSDNADSDFIESDDEGNGMGIFWQ